MKKYSMLALVFVLTATLLAGCRNPGPGSSPTTTTPATTTRPAATTRPATTTTTPLPTDATIPGPEDILPDMTNPTGTTNGGDMTRRRPQPRY